VLLLVVQPLLLPHPRLLLLRLLHLDLLQPPPLILPPWSAAFSAAVFLLLHAIQQPAQAQERAATTTARPVETTASMMPTVRCFFSVLKVFRCLCGVLISRPGMDGGDLARMQIVSAVEGSRRRFDMSVF
jgi:hypothetical protein